MLKLLADLRVLADEWEAHAREIAGTTSDPEQFAGEAYRDAAVDLRRFIDALDSRR